MLFKTDYSVTNTGFSIGRARVCCSSTPNNNTIPIFENDRFQGILLGTNDVVYMRYYPPENRDVTIALWGTGPDVDLYARCGAMPTPTQWDFRGFSGDAQEFIHIIENQCTGGIPIYIAAHAYYIIGPQTFNLAVHHHDPGYHILGAVAKTMYNASAQDMDTWRNTLQLGARRFFGMTEGSIYMTTVDVRNNTGDATGIFLYSSSTGLAVVKYDEYLCDSTTHMNLYLPGNPTLSPKVVAHEMGHMFGCMHDEYHNIGPGNSQSHCGHSMMSNYFQSDMNNNLCFCNSWNGSVCALNMGDHYRDGTIAPNEIYPPNWNVIQTAPYVSVPTRTPDNFSYENFDFNRLVADII
jgi:hypothetical protein